MGKILAIDDEEDYTNILKILLEKEGHNVTVANSGKDGLEKLDAEKFDLVILDIMMPVMDGFEVCTKIREKWKTLPVAIVSVKGSEEDIVQGLFVGANDYFTKPYNKIILLSKIDSLINFSKMERELEEHSKELEKKVAERTEELEEVNEKLEKEYWKLEKDLELAKYQMEHEGIKVVFIARLTGIFTAVLLLSLIILITTGNVYYLGILLALGMAVAGFVAQHSQGKMKRTINEVEELKPES